MSSVIPYTTTTSYYIVHIRYEAPIQKSSRQPIAWSDWADWEDEPPPVSLNLTTGISRAEWMIIITSLKLTVYASTSTYNILVAT